MDIIYKNRVRKYQPTDFLGPTCYSTQSPLHRQHFLPDSYQDTTQGSACQAEIRGNALARIDELVNLTMVLWILWRLCLIGRPNMSGADEKLQAVLEGYSNFLREKKLAMPKHQPHLVRWVREFLLFARKHSDHPFEQTLDLFLTAPGQRAGVKP